MTLKYLLDENVNPVYKIQLRQQRPDLVIWTVGGEPTTPPKGTLSSICGFYLRKDLCKRSNDYQRLLTLHPRKNCKRSNHPGRDIHLRHDG